MTDKQQQDQRNAEVAWVAGVSAQAGLGAALARRFARAGLTAVVTGRTLPKLESVVREIRDAGGSAVALSGDVTQEADLQNIAARVAEFGALRVAVFNAGSFERAPSLELSVEVFEQAWRTNTLGGFIFAREAVRLLLPHSRGTLLFTGATASLRGRPPFGAFAAAKAGLRSISQTFAREFGPRGIHVAHVVIDGSIDGERLRSIRPGQAEQAARDGLLDPEALADLYFQLHLQPRNAWTHELDVRPYSESF